MRKTIVFFIMFLMFASVGFAENIYLKDGRVIRDVRIIGRNSYSVIVAGQGRYFLTDIERIGEDIVEKTEEGKEASEEAKGAEGVKTDEKAEDKDGLEDKSKEELILELFFVNGMKETIDNNIANLNKQLPEAKREELNKIVDAKELLESMIPVYGNNFSKEEVIDLIRFYKSSAGSKLLKDTPKLMEQIMIATVDYYKDKITKIKQ